MKSFTNIIGAGVLTLTMATMPLIMPASAQTDTAPGTTTAPDTTINTAPTDGTNNVEGDRDFDWGWLGLIGLAGLAGLAAKKRSEPAAYRDPNAVSSTGYRE